MASQYRLHTEEASLLGLVYAADQGLSVMALSRQASPLLLDESETGAALMSVQDDAQPFLHSDPV